MPYQFHIHNFQDQAKGEAARMGMDAMEADGWTIAASQVNFTEVSVLWHKPAQAAGDDTKAKG